MDNPSDINQSSPSFADRVRNLFLSVFALSEADWVEHEGIWNEWLAARKREWRDLDALLKSDVKDVFKARAKALQLTPNTNDLPFAWGQGSVMEYSEVPPLTELSPDLFAFTLFMLELNIEAGVRHEHCTLGALGLLSENDPAAERLFKRYELNDAYAHESMDTASGYTPFRNLLCADIPEKWKIRGDARMREIVLSEAEGRSTPRAEHEDALYQYCDHISGCFHREPFSYGDVLLASQIEFILDLPNLSGRKLFNSTCLANILDHIGDDHQKNLRRRLARHVLLEDRGEYGGFKVHNKEQRRIACRLLEEFGESDPELATELRLKITEGDRANREHKAKDAEQKAREAAALARLR